MAKRKTKKAKKPRKVKILKTRNLNTWSESEFFSRIRSSLRRTFRYFKPIQKALDLASRPNQSENKRLKKEYQCAHCLQWFKRADVEIDHKIEAGSLRCYEDIVPFIIRLTSENVDDYQILCKNKCHKEKTKKYRDEKTKK